MAPNNLLKLNGARATKPSSPFLDKLKKEPCNCSRQLAREKVQLRFFLRQLIRIVGSEALTDMFKGFHIPIPGIQTMFEAELHTHMVSNNKEGSLPKDAQGKPKRMVAPSDFILVKDELVDAKKKQKKADGPNERIFIDLTEDDFVLVKDKLVEDAKKKQKKADGPKETIFIDLTEDDFILVKDELVEDAKEKQKKADGPKETIFVDLTEDD